MYRTGWAVELTLVLEPAYSYRSVVLLVYLRTDLNVNL